MNSIRTRQPERRRRSGSTLLMSIAANGFGVVIAQAISLVSMAFVGRWYSPSDLGVLGMTVGAVAILSPIATMTYANAICVARNEADSLNLARLAFIGTLTVTVIGIVTSFLFFINGIDGWINAVMGTLLLFSTATLGIITQTTFRKRFIRLRSVALIGSALTVAGLRIIGGIASPSGIMLIGAVVVGNVSAGFIMASRYPGILAGRFLRGVRRRSLFRTARRYQDFPYYTAPHSLLRYGILAYPPLALGWLADEHVAGQYTLAASVISGPILMIADALGDAVTRPFAQALDKDQATAVAAVRRLTVQASILAAIPVLLLWAASSFLFSTVFGPAWSDAAQFAKWLALWGGAMLASRPLMCLIPVVGLQQALLRVEIITAVLRIVFFTVALLFFNSPLLAIIVFSVLGLLQSITMSFKVFDRLSMLGDRTIYRKDRAAS
ncbi:MATE family efflux transporter [Sphingomonas edaphi]|nr:hypothetical protein [Sphingomonas edaphi]